MRSFLPTTRAAFIRRVKGIRPGLWLLPVVTFAGFYLYRPFVLGFYSDDWGGIFDTARHGGPFSLERFLFRWKTFTRPLMNIQTYLDTSILGTSSVAWHFFLIILVAITCFLLRKFLLALGASPTAATLVSTAWLVFPWSLGYRVWPVCSTILLSTICFLAGSLALLKQRLWTSLAWYAASMLLYEAFYFQFVAILVIMVFSSETRRWALRRATPLLVLLQVGVLILNRLSASQSPGLAKSYHSDWILRFGYSLARTPLTLSEGIAGGLVLGAVTIGLSLLFVIVCVFRTKDRRRRVALLAAAVGLVIAYVVLSIAGYRPLALGTLSRTSVCVDIWLAALLALPWTTSARTPWMSWALRVGVAAVFAVLAVSTVIRVTTWQHVWDNEKAVLEAVPVEAVAATDVKAVIVVRDFPYADGVPPFSSYWEMTFAVADAVPGNHVVRSFYPAWPGMTVSWDGLWLSADGTKVRRASELWLWRWPSKTLEPVTSAGDLPN